MLFQAIFQDEQADHSTLLVVRTNDRIETFRIPVGEHVGLFRMLPVDGAISREERRAIGSRVRFGRTFDISSGLRPVPEIVGSVSRV